MNYDWLKKETGPKVIVEIHKFRGGPKALTQPSGLKKLCICCGGEYVSRATKRHRKGRCRSCINTASRNDYKRKENGLFAYYELLKQGKKRCTQCGEIKLVSFFSFHNYGRTLRVSCKSCDSIAYKNYEINNKEKINANRRNRRKDPVRGIIFSQRDRQRALFKQKGVNKNQPCTQLIRDWMGCSVSDCKIYLESKFLDGMFWTNRGVGRDKWQIDHVIPISLTKIDCKGNIIDNEFNRKIWHHTNLQPLWHIENAMKSNKYKYAA